MKKLIRRFGAMVIGAERAAKEKVEIKSPKRKFGPMVTGSKVLPGTNTPAPGSFAIANPSVMQLKELLTDNPAFLDTYVNQEFSRPTMAIRPKALQLFVQVAPLAYPETPAKAQAIVERCQAFLDGEGELAANALTKAHIARGKQVGDADSAKAKGASSVKPSKDAVGGRIAKGTKVGGIAVK